MHGHTYGLDERIGGAGLAAPSADRVSRPGQPGAARNAERTGQDDLALIPPGAAAGVDAGAVIDTAAALVDEATGGATGSQGAAARGIRAAAQLAADLPAVVHDYPAAVLLIDTASGEVVYANDLATQLAPGTSLPASAQDWSTAARLQVIGGGALAESTTPLVQIAAGDPTAGRQVSAALATQAAAAREALWIIGLPLLDAPGLLGQRSLVVLLPVRFPEAVASIQDAATHARGVRSVLVSDLSMAISDAQARDDPLIWVSDGFERVTGFSRTQVMGRNCRFLQGPDTDPEVLARISAALHSGQTVSETLLNYRADGSAFFNHLLISPIRDGDGQVIHHVAVQTDITQRVLAERDRELARRSVAAARHAQAAAEAEGAFDQLLLSLSEALAATSTVDDVASTIARVAATVGATGSVLGLPARAGTQMQMTSMAHLPDDTDPAWASLPVQADTPMTVAARTGRATFFPDLSATLAAHPHLRQVAGLPQVGATAQLPLLLAGASTARFAVATGLLPKASSGDQSGATEATGALEVVGVVGLTWPGPRQFSPREQAALEALGRYSAQALQRALLAAERRQAAHLLQESLLTELPAVQGVQLAASYLPTASEEHVGGDWYDVVELPDGSVVVVIGDVTGHDLAAAARMGQMRALLRAYAYDRQELPSQTITRLDRALPGLGVEGMATVVLGRLQPAPADRAGQGAGQGGSISSISARAGGYLLRWANAGHLPPMLVDAGGAVSVLEHHSELLIGIDPSTDRTTHEHHVQPGSTLVLYTDGLVERRGRSISEGIEVLSGLLSAHHHLSVQALADLVTAELVGDAPIDDCALLLVRMPADQVAVTQES